MRTHSRPQSPRSFWPVAGIESSGQKAGPDFLSMRRVSVSYYQPIRFARFDGKSVNCGLPVLDKARALDSCHRPEGSWALGTRMVNTPIQTCVIIDWQPCSDWCKHCEGPFVNGLIDDDEKVAFSKRHTQFNTGVQKPYPIYNQNGQNRYPISDPNCMPFKESDFLHPTPWTLTVIQKSCHR